LIRMPLLDAWAVLKAAQQDMGGVPYTMTGPPNPADNPTQSHMQDISGMIPQHSPGMGGQATPAGGQASQTHPQQQAQQPPQFNVGQFLGQQGQPQQGQPQQGQPQQGQPQQGQPQQGQPQQGQQGPATTPHGPQQEETGVTGVTGGGVTTPTAAAPAPEDGQQQPPGGGQVAVMQQQRQPMMQRGPSQYQQAQQKGQAAHERMANKFG
jgi:hypothetical protein